MKSYDVIVIGAGVGLNVTFKAVSSGLRVALIDKGNLGGTCLNLGCVPSKMLIFPADRIVEIREAEKLGIHAKITSIDFSALMGRMKKTIRLGRKYLADAIKNSKNLDFYNEQAYFVDEYTLKIKNHTVRGKKIFISSGSRPSIPPIKGLENVDYLTNESILDVKKAPKSIIVVGGGYIASEYAHFFDAVGAKVTVLEMGERLIASEEPEISHLLKKELSRRMEILTNASALEVKKNKYDCTVLVKVKNKSTKEIMAEKIMIATGRKSNADFLRVEKSGIETDSSNYIKVNDYLETNKRNIWAFGDATGKQMFTHAGDKEAEIAWHNATSGKKIRMDFLSIPYAIFTHPQVASVGLTEAEARKDHEILVGRAKYSDIVAGDTMVEKDGFAKAIVEKKMGKILGFHVVGPYASHIIQEVVNAMANKNTVDYITNSIHTFPSLSELIPQALDNLS
jgi:mycothione reductase